MKTFSSLKNPVFRLYYGALLAARAALNMQLVARSLLIWELTGSKTLLGLMNLAYAIPLLLTALFGGAIANRVHKKYNMLMGQVVSAVMFLIIAVCLTTGYINSDNTGSWWVIMAAAIINGVFSGIMMPSRHAIIPEIVGEKNLTNAIALNNLAMNLLRLFGPALAGFVIDAYDFDVAYYAMAALAAIAVIFTIVMPLTGKIIKSSQNMFANIREGFSYIWQNKFIMFILIFVMFSIMLSRPVTVLMPVFGDILNVGKSEIGILFSIAGAGAIISTVVLASLPDKKRGLLMLAGSLVLGMALIGFSVSSSFYLSLSLMFVFGLGQAMRMTLGNTLIQYYTEAKYRGRVMSIYTMDFAFTSLGTAAAAFIAEYVGVQWVVGSSAAVLIIISLLVTAFVPKIRKLD